MSETILKVENVSKQYRLGLVGSGTIKDDLKRWWFGVRGKEDPFLKVGESNDRTSKGNSEYVWALRDINFEVKRGEVLGIIGKNGAGKSTLLKILSKITSPTTGSIKYNGRIASLLEVGTGFHPELTGKENIYLNGAILGMTKAEISAKYNEIVEFSGCERYIDTPVKRYSSGMTVRLAFAVAAFLEPDILIIDEVLAVGDAEFQKKAIGKMQDISRGEGRTVLFVSHNMTAVANLCDTIYVLNKGLIDFYGQVDEGIEYYLKIPNEKKNNKNILPDDKDFKLEEIKLLQNGVVKSEFYTNKKIEVHYNFKVKRELTNLRVGFELVDANNSVIFRTFHDDDKETVSFKKGVYNLKGCIPQNFLKTGNYSINIVIGIHNVKWISFREVVIPISLYNIKGINNKYADDRPGIIMPLIDWEIKNL